MLDQIVKEFSASSVAGEVLGVLKEKAGLGTAEAQGVLAATTEGAAGALGGEGVGGLAALLGGGGGAAAALGGLLGGGGGGLGGALGGLLGGASPASSPLPAALTDKIVGFVTGKTGISADQARLAVGLVLPKLIEFVKSRAA